MLVQSPLSHLSDILTQMRESAARYQVILRKNEAATRAVLIDPMLRALGWDTANTSMVEVEKTLDQVRADYALYDSNATVRIIIEAKSLGTNLSQPGFVMSLINYAFAFQLQDVFLTDGLIWQHFSNFQPGNVKVERILDLSHDDPVECAAYLVQRLDAAKFWPEEQSIDRLAQQVSQLESMVATLQQELHTLKRSVETLAPQPPAVPAPLKLPALDYVPLDALTDTNGRRPSHLRLPDGTELPIKRWKDVLRECCKYVLTTNRSLQLPLPDRAGKKVYLINTLPPAPGLSHVTEEYNGQIVYIYVNYDARNIVANARHVVQYVPPAAARVSVGVALVSTDA